MKPLIVFTTPLTSSYELRPDSGAIFRGVMGADDEGRPGLLVTLDENLPEGHGAQEITTHEGFNPMEQRGRLWLKERNGVKLERPEFIPDDRILSRSF